MFSLAAAAATIAVAPSAAATTAAAATIAAAATTASVATLLLQPDILHWMDANEAEIWRLLEENPANLKPCWDHFWRDLEIAGKDF